MRPANGSLEVTYEFLDHTGDVAVQIMAADGKELFRDAASALLDILVDQQEGAPVEDVRSLPVKLESEDAESLLIDFLNELIFLFDSQRYLCAKIDWKELSLEDPAQLEGVLRGEILDEARHLPLTEVKAATFHAVEIRKTSRGLGTQVVFDL